MALGSEKKEGIIREYARNSSDTGSTEVQIALLTERVSLLTEHLKMHKKDHSSRLGLLKLVGQRRRLMRYLKNSSRSAYNDLIAKLSIRDNI